MALALLPATVACSSLSCPAVKVKSATFVLFFLTLPAAGTSTSFPPICARYNISSNPAGLTSASFGTIILEHDSAKSATFVLFFLTMPAAGTFTTCSPIGVCYNISSNPAGLTSASFGTII